MTREQAIKHLEVIKGDCALVGDLRALDMAISALSENKGQPLSEVLDKIRAEIEKLQKMCDKNDLNLMAQYSAFGMVLDIIDKHKAESEGSNDKNHS